MFLADGTTPVFSEKEALRYVHDLATHEDGSPRYRIVGTEEMVLTEEYLLKEVDRVRQLVVERMPAGLHQIEVWHQVRRADKTVSKLAHALTEAVIVYVARLGRTSLP
jgi:hypothetical protein